MSSVVKESGALATLQTKRGMPADEVAFAPLKPVSDPADPIMLILRDYRCGDLQVVSANVKLTEALRAKGLVQTLQLPPGIVGIEPGNRSAMGINTAEVRNLMEKIFSVGWSDAETSHACCFQQAPGKTDVENFTKAMCQGTDIPAVETGSIMYGATSCTHTNMGLRAIGLAGISDHPVISDGHHYCLTRLEQRDPAFATAVKRGLTWTVFSWKAKALYPEVVGIISRARNVGATIARTEDEMEILLRLHHLASKTAEGQAVPWQDVKQEVMRSRPRCHEKLDAMISFLIARSGGAGGEHLKAMCAFHRVCVEPTYRDGIGATVYESLADFPHHALASALFECAWTCPKAFVKDKQCTMVAGGDVSAMVKNTEESHVKRMKAANALCIAFRSVIRPHRQGPPSSWPNDIQTLLGNVDTHVGRYMLNKQLAKHDFKSLVDIAKVFVKGFCELVPEAVDSAAVNDLVNQIGEGVGLGDASPGSTTGKAKAKSKGNAKAKAKSSATASGTSSQEPYLPMYELDDDGGLVSTIGKLRADGWDIGAKLTLGSPPEGFARSDVYAIADAKSAVVLHLVSDRSRSTSLDAKSFLQHAQRISDAPACFDFEWASHRVVHSNGAIEAFQKANVLYAIQVLCQGTGKDLEQSIAIQTAPGRRVLAKCDIDTGGIVLVPECAKCFLLAGQQAIDEANKLTSVEVFYEPKVNADPTPKIAMSEDPAATGTTGAAAAAATQAIEAEGEAMRHFITPGTSGEYVSPFWLIGESEDEAKSNMARIMYRVQLMGFADPFAQAPGDEPAIASATSELQDIEACEAKATGAVAKSAPKDAAARKVSETKASGKGQSKAGKAMAKITSPLTAPPVALARAVQRKDGQGVPMERFVHIPVLVNTRPVKANEVLQQVKISAKAKDDGKAKRKAITTVDALKKAKLRAT